MGRRKPPASRLDRFHAASLASWSPTRPASALPPGQATWSNRLPDCYLGNLRRCWAFCLTKPAAQALLEVYPAQGTSPGAGCPVVRLCPAGRRSEINWATPRVLARNGVEVIIPPDQGCCGGLALHTGDHDGPKTGTPEWRSSRKMWTQF
jgi:hypothetical protein